jgi:hypothetical protein
MNVSQQQDGFTEMEATADCQYGTFSAKLRHTPNGWVVP